MNEEFNKLIDDLDMYIKGRSFELASEKAREIRNYWSNHYKPVSRDQGTVTLVTRKLTTIEFQTRWGPIAKRFPSKRVQEIGAARIGTLVECEIGHIGEYYLSRLCFVAQPPKYEEEFEREFSPEELKELDCYSYEPDT